MRYGHAFYDQWRDADPDAVVEDWREALDGITARMVKHALSVLPERPMNASQFRWICLQAPAEPGQEAIGYTPARQTPEQRDVLRTVAAAMRQPDMRPGPMLLERLKTWEHRNPGERMTMAQRQQLAALELQFAMPAETAQEAQ
jgi:hypothetical protein